MNREISDFFLDMEYSKLFLERSQKIWQKQILLKNTL
nr:MAG TPA: hypothetical protein [Caudoviricetes sp.]